MPTVHEPLAAAVAAALVEPRRRPCDPSRVHLERPARREHGDWSTNVALATAKAAGRPPRAAGRRAGRAAERRRRPPTSAASRSPGPASSTSACDDTLAPRRAQRGRRRGRGGLRPARRSATAQRVQVEFVSANPTGPIHVGNGWWASYGDALARLLERCGYDGQPGVLRQRHRRPDPPPGRERAGPPARHRRRPRAATSASSSRAWPPPTTVPTTSPRPAGGPPSGPSATSSCRWRRSTSTSTSGSARRRSRRARRSTRPSPCCGRGAWSSRRTAPPGCAPPTSATPGSSGCCVKSDGDCTYLAGDIAYHRNKFLVRGFDRVIDVWGADHQGQVASLKAGVAALGIDPDRLEIRLGQMISLASGKMSKRAGNAVDLDDLVDDIGPDAIRLSQPGQLDRPGHDGRPRQGAGRVQGEPGLSTCRWPTPASPASAGRRPSAGVVRRPLADVDLSLLDPRAGARPAALPVGAARGGGRRPAPSGRPTRSTTWVRELADRFHGFYHDCYVLHPDVPAS